MRRCFGCAPGAVRSCQVWPNNKNAMVEDQDKDPGVDKIKSTEDREDQGSPIIRLVQVSEDMIRYDARCYFNVRSKANMSQLNLPHGTDN